MTFTHDPAALTAFIQTLARHALPLFLATLAMVLVVVAVLWLLGARYGLRREDSRLPPVAYLALYLVLGFAVIAGAAAGFAEIAEALGDGEQLGRLDLLFSDTVRDTISLPVLRVFALLTHLGDPIVLGVICVVVGLTLLWQRQWLLAAGWGFGIVGNAVLNTTLKHIFERTRPVHDHGLAMADGFSFPSGHASGSLVVYAMLAYVLVRRLPPQWPAGARLGAVLLAAAAAFTTGSSRVFLQVHFATDVMAGFASGTAWLALTIGSLELLRWHSARRTG